ncbi:MAG: RIP metalloprotease RseP [Lachnospiraceae bacterium]|nr:RIP metalloprotease RseP [Lachnospiraceae bacterium]
MKWLIAFIIFSIIILYHEFGHFIVAKLNGVAVEEFSFGFGPRIVSAVKNGTRYSWKVLPFGGSCQMKGMLGEEEEGKQADEDSFNAKSWGRRAAIIFAGPFFNFMLAFLAAIVLIGVMGADPAKVTNVSEEIPLREGDLIRSVNGKSMATGRDVDGYFTYRTLKEGDLLKVTFVRDGQKMTESFPVITQYRVMMGISYYADDEEAVLSAVQEGSPAEEAGMKAGDVITAVNGTPITTGAELHAYMEENPPSDREIVLTLHRNGRDYEARLVPKLLPYSDPGFACYTAREKTGPVETLGYAFAEIRFWIRTVFSSLKMLATGRAGVEDLSGPVGVVNVISDTYDDVQKEGTLIVVMTMLNLLILLSANVGVMNLLPFPGLDGGRLLLIAVEIVIGHKVSQKVENVISFVGMALLMFLMVVVLYNDIMKLF